MRQLLQASLRPFRLFLSRISSSVLGLDFFFFLALPLSRSSFESSGSGKSLTSPPLVGRLGLRRCVGRQSF